MASSTGVKSSLRTPPFFNAKPAQLEFEKTCVCLSDSYFNKLQKLKIQLPQCHVQNVRQR